ncbi:MAG: adenylyltransferase/cytidyltransferase family protein [Candidatus Nanohalobium sp.]
MTDKTVFLGRFQPIHKGHKQVIEDHIDREENFAVVIGSAGKKREEKNPLSAEEREKLIKSCFSGLEILELEDEGQDEEGNQRWLQKLKGLGVDKVISQNSLVKELVREDEELELIEQDMYDPEIYSGTEVRRRIRSGEEWRYLVPKCSEDQLEEYLEAIKDSGIQYDFKPGWKRENAYHDTYEK